MKNQYAQRKSIPKAIRYGRLRPRYSLSALLLATLLAGISLAIYRYFSQATVLSHPQQFDGRTDVAAVPDAPSFDLDSTFTIEARIKLPPRQSSRFDTSCIVSKGSGVLNTEHNYYLGVINANNRLHFHIGDGGGGYQHIVSEKPLSHGIWIRVAAIRADDTLTLYVDGKKCSEVKRTLDQATNDAPLHIGATEDTRSRFYFAGEIDEIRIWNYPRTQKQLDRSFQFDAKPSMRGLVLVSKRDEETGDELSDATESR